jgi:DNA-directed RNA polymerase specialized sigma24 family protein
MNMDEYITKNYNSLRNKVKAVTKNHQNSDDLFNDLLTTLYTKPKEYQEDLIKKNKVENWIMASAKLQFASRTSPFYYKYKKFNHDTSDIYENTLTTDDEYIDFSQDIVNFIKSELELYYTVYQRTLTTEHLIYNKSYSEIGREYKVNRKYISETITPVKEELFKKVKELWNI